MFPLKSLAAFSQERIGIVQPFFVHSVTYSTPIWSVFYWQNHWPNIRTLFYINWFGSLWRTRTRVVPVLTLYRRYGLPRRPSLSLHFSRFSFPRSILCDMAWPRPSSRFRRANPATDLGIYYDLELYFLSNCETSWSDKEVTVYLNRLHWGPHL